MPIAPSNRALAKVLGVDEKAVRKAEKAGRIQRTMGVGYDVEACRKAWAGGTEPERSKVRTSADLGPQGPQSEVRTPTEAREAVALITRVLIEEGILRDGAPDFAAARLAETVLKVRQRELAIAERKRKLVPLAAVRDHTAKAFAGFRQSIQRMPSRYAAEIAAELQVDCHRLTAALDRMIAATLNEMSAPVVRG